MKTWGKPVYRSGQDLEVGKTYEKSCTQVWLFTTFSTSADQCRSVRLSSISLENGPKATRRRRVFHITKVDNKRNKNSLKDLFSL